MTSPSAFLHLVVSDTSDKHPGIPHLLADRWNAAQRLIPLLGAYRTLHPADHDPVPVGEQPLNFQARLGNRARC